MTLLFFAFVGWEMIGNLAEVQKPGRDLPLSLGIALLLVNLLYFAVAFVTVGTRVYQSEFRYLYDYTNWLSLGQSIGNTCSLPWIYRLLLSCTYLCCRFSA